MVKVLHDLSSGSVSDALRAVSPHPDVNVGEASGSCRIFSTRACRPFGSSGLNIGEASGSCRIFSTRACRPFGSSGLNIKIQGLRGEKPVSRNRCRIYRSNSSTASKVAYGTGTTANAISLAQHCIGSTKQTLLHRRRIEPAFPILGPP